MKENRPYDLNYIASQIRKLKDRRKKFSPPSNPYGVSKEDFKRKTKLREIEQ